MGDINVLERILSGREKPTNLALAVLEEITEKFSNDRRIGRGGFAEVYMGVFQNRSIAVKRIILNDSTIDDMIFDREAKNLMTMGIISHPNVVRFLGFCSNGYDAFTKDQKTGNYVKVQIRERLLCFDYISNGSLDKHITDELRGLDWSTRYEIIKGICQGLHHLHEEQNIIHMDLTPGNIMLDNEMVPKITDFGLSRFDKNTHTIGPSCRTPGYCAPEYENDGKREPSKKADMYSLGVIITELVTGRRMGNPNKHKVLRRWGYRWKKSPKHSSLPLSQYQREVLACLNIAADCREENPIYRPHISSINPDLKAERMNMHDAQINDDMLGIEPLDLRFPFEPRKPISFKVQLTNETEKYYGFIIETPGLQYLAQPDEGIVSPQSDRSIQISIMQAQRPITYHFTVISTTLDEDPSDEHIRKHFINKDPSKVDDVTLAVVTYNPEKSQGNASAEAVSKDHRRNFHPPQSFSSDHPTNMRYLNRQSDRAMDLATGAMGSLLHKLGELLKEEFNLEASVKKEIESFSEELMKMWLVLRKLQDVQLENNEDYFLVKRWANNVREMSYDIEDFVDGFLVHSEPTADVGGSSELTHRDSEFKNHHKISEMIKTIKERVQDEAKRCKEYNVHNAVAVAPTEITGTIDPRMSPLVPSFRHHKDLVGIKERRDDLIKRLCDGVVQLKIFSIYGSGGLGKTTLVREVYDKLDGGQLFRLRAFVSLGRNPDTKEVFRDIIKELNSGNTANLNEQELIKELQRLLENKSYLIVIDDIWDPTAWDVIKSAFPDNNCGSRVVTTTRLHNVAIACCNNRDDVYEVKILSEQDSRTLFVRRIYGTEEACPNVQEEILTSILKKCGGLPLAIVSIASLLRAKNHCQMSTWKYVSKSLVAMFEGDNPTLKEVGQILDLSYRHLPHHLKTCLLSVGKYREDHEIEKDELLRQWIAEGFVISTARGLDAEDVAEEYFKELINMSMIQPAKIDYNDEVLSCRVHDIVLDLIRSKAAHENFCLVMDGSKDRRQPPEKVRRVSIHYHGQMDCRALAVAATSGSLAHVRSVLFLGGRYIMRSFLTLKYVRVLHLEDDGGTSHLDLSIISELFLLRYLKIVCFFFATELKLPSRFEELQQLETIDVAAARNIPQGIVSLARLLHLNVGIGAVLPEGIGRLKSLRTLGWFNLATHSMDNIKCLGELTNLRDLTICWSPAGQTDPMDAGMRMEALRSSIGSLSGSLRTLIIGIGCSIQLPVHGWTWSSAHFHPPCNLQKLDLTGCDFDRCPEWIAKLPDLYSLRIRVMEVADGVSTLAKLRSLAYLYLECHGERQETADISGFGALKHLDLDCKNMSLTFQAGAMPRLEKLEIWFRYNLSFITGYFIPRGIEHLPQRTLRQICLKVVDAEQHKLPVRHMFERAFWSYHLSGNITIYFHERIYY